MKSKWNAGRDCEDNEIGSQAYEDRQICHYLETKNHATFKAQKLKSLQTLLDIPL